jgi:hypothetical protein
LPFCQIIGGVQLIHAEEAQDVSSVFPQSIGKPRVIWVGQFAFGVNQFIQTRFCQLFFLG